MLRRPSLRSWVATADKQQGSRGLVISLERPRPRGHSYAIGGTCNGRMFARTRTFHREGQHVGFSFPIPFFVYGLLLRFVRVHFLEMQIRRDRLEKSSALSVTQSFRRPAGDVSAAMLCLRAHALPLASGITEGLSYFSPCRPEKPTRRI